MATSSGPIPDVLPSQVLSVSPSLPTNKLLDNLTVNTSFIFFFCLFIYFLNEKFSFRKTKDFYNHYHKIMKNVIFLQDFIKLYLMIFSIRMNVLIYNFMQRFVLRISFEFMHQIYLKYHQKKC